uniref:LRAT domain-containing protein n=1 Tax=Leptobrachium leishanense TaxID=445787 RepID=A0A8C5R2Z0_9ANUR
MALEGSQPNLGDLLEFPRDRYSHWGVYVGDEKIVHVIAESLVRGSVMKQLVTVVADGNRYRVNNKYDKRCAPRKPKEIVKSADKEVGNLTDYNLLTNNCEHFATMMRYGKTFSDQVTDAEETAVMAGAGVVTLPICPPVALGLLVSASVRSKK